MCIKLLGRTSTKWLQAARAFNTSSSFTFALDSLGTAAAGLSVDWWQPWHSDQGTASSTLCSCNSNVDSDTSQCTSSNGSHSASSRFVTDKLPHMWPAVSAQHFGAEPSIMQLGAAWQCKPLSEAAAKLIPTYVLQLQPLQHVQSRQLQGSITRWQPSVPCLQGPAAAAAATVAHIQWPFSNSLITTTIAPAGMGADNGTWQHSRCCYHTAMPLARRYVPDELSDDGTDPSSDDEVYLDEDEFEHKDSQELAHPGDDLAADEDEVEFDVEFDEAWEDEEDVDDLRDENSIQ